MFEELRGRRYSGLLVAIVASALLAGCALAEGGADLVFGPTNPYVDPEIEEYLTAQNEKALAEAANALMAAPKPAAIANAGDAQNNAGVLSLAAPGTGNDAQTATDEIKPCIAHGDDGKSVTCVVSFNSSWGKSDPDELKIYVNHPYYRYLRQKAAQCDSLLSQQEVDDLKTLYGVAADGTKVTLSPEADYACRAARNKLVHLYMSTSDRACVSRLASIGAGKTSTNLLLNFTNITSSAVATFAGVASTARWLSALSLATSQTGALLDDELFGRALNSAMATKIVEKQEETRQSIEDDLKKSIKLYGVEEALRDARQYNQQCSYAYGQQLVTEAVNGTEETQPQAVENHITRLTTMLEAATKERDTLSTKLDELKAKVKAETITEKERVDMTVLKAKIDLQTALEARIASEAVVAQDRLITMSRPR